MTEARISVQDFSLANAIYAGARVTFWTVSGAGAKTTTTATLYAAATGSTTLANPQTLDRDGKFSAPVYINAPVIATVAGRRIDSHDTGIIGTMFAATPVSVPGGTAGQILIISSGLAGVWRTVSGAFTINEFGVATLTQSAASDLSNGTTGSGNVVLKTSPTLVTPVLGIATATSINGLTISTTTGTITLTNGKTLSVSNTMTLAGTDGRTYTFPTTSGTVVTADSTAALTNKTFNASSGGNVFTVNGVALSRGQFPGTQTNDNAATGNIGEYISSDIAVGSAVALTTGTPANVTFIDITAGDWDVTINGYALANGATTVAYFTASMSTTSATLSATSGWFGTLSGFPTAGDTLGSVAPSVNAGPIRMNVTGTTRVYFVAQSGFGVNTMKAWGIIHARRVR